MSSLPETPQQQRLRGRPVIPNAAKVNTRLQLPLSGTQKSPRAAHGGLFALRQIRKDQMPAIA